MTNYPAKRCQHIKVNGTQCGSPALSNQNFCYYHQGCRPKVLTIRANCRDYSSVDFLLPAFEDANSIQFALRRVTELILINQLDYKKSGLLLYALQIASSNLKRIEAESPRPTQVVVDPETVSETPMGMTPWSATGQGHDPEDEQEDATVRDAERAEAKASGEMVEKLAHALRCCVGEDLTVEALKEKLAHLADAADRDSERHARKVPGLPGETIQACIEPPHRKTRDARTIRQRPPYIV